ncbi:hypothetical protein LIA77_09212 [Sarocladium implicatum]|nr:hypothetical protein LIA77_09212 [Sarocladium implicatum]
MGHHVAFLLCNDVAVLVALHERRVIEPYNVSSSADLVNLFVVSGLPGVRGRLSCPQVIVCSSPWSLFVHAGHFRILRNYRPVFSRPTPLDLISPVRRTWHTVPGAKPWMIPRLDTVSSPGAINLSTN